MDTSRFKKIEKEYLRNLETNLKKIYDNQEGNVSNISYLRVRRASWTRRILIAEIVVLFIFLGGIVFFWFGNNTEKTNKYMDIRIEIPEKVASGENITTTLYYKNKEHYNLRDIELVVQFPENFEYVYSDPLPSNDFHDIWKLGDLIVGEEGRVTITGRVIGDIGTLISIKTAVTYKPENINSTFKQEFASEITQITSSIFSIDLNGPDSVIPNQEVSYKIHYKNTSMGDISNALVKVQFPEDFVFISSKPQDSVIPLNEIQEGTQVSMKKYWLFMDLRGGVEGDIEISGRYDQSNNQRSQINYQIGILNDKYFVSYQDKKFPFQIINHGLSLSILANGSKEDNSVNFSDALNYTIIFKNLGTQTLYNIRLSAQLTSQVLDWDTLIDKYNGVRQKNVIQWDSSSVPMLAILPPLSDGSIDFSIRLKNASKVNILKDNLKTSAIAEANIEKIGNNQLKIKVQSKPVNSNVNTDLELKVEGRYFNDDNIAVGQGPLPPVSGTKTTFRIYWFLTNNLHQVSNVILKTNLSPDAKWEDKFSSTVGTLLYNPSNNSITWEIPKISSNKTEEDLNGWFDVSITPKENQVGKLILLITDTTLIAKDDITSSAISQVFRGVTTNLEDDPIGGGRGLVEKGN